MGAVGLEGELAVKPAARAAILQTNGDVRMMRQTVASGMWDIPVTVLSELPMQCQLVTRNERYVLTEDGKVETDGDGNPLTEPANYSERTQQQARKMLRQMIKDNANVVATGLSETLSDRRESVETVEAGVEVLEQLKDMLRTRGYDPEKVIEDGYRKERGQREAAQSELAEKGDADSPVKHSPLGV